MRERTPELRNVLATAIKKAAEEKFIESRPDEIKRSVMRGLLNQSGPYSSETTSRWSKEKWNEYWLASEERIKGNEEKLKQKTALINLVSVFLETCESLTDEEFELQYRDLQEALDELLASDVSDRNFKLSFVEISKIESLDQFVKGRWPMQFVPHKAEVGRILTLAKNMRDERAKRGEITEDAEITIVDIGGANGALGKLVSDLAKENNLPLKFVTVDPDEETVQAAAQTYQDDASLHFLPLDSTAFVQKLHGDNFKIAKLIGERTEFINTGTKKQEELKLYLERIQRDYFASNTMSDAVQRATIKIHCRVLKQDFGIDLNDDSFASIAELDVFFEDQYTEDEYGNLKTIHYVDRYADEHLRPAVAEMTANIEKALLLESPAVDLVINSWMPPRMDFSAEIRFVNGAAILYALERGGATGCQIASSNPELPAKLGEESSYRQGESYKTKLGWVSHSTPQIRRMRDLRPKSVPLSERLIEHNEGSRGGEELVIPFSNGFIIQTRSDFDTVVTADNLEKGVLINGRYPWEDELVAQGGDTLPVHEITEKDDAPDLTPAVPKKHRDA